VAQGGVAPITANRFDNYVGDNGDVLHQSAYESENPGTHYYYASISNTGGTYTDRGEIMANQGGYPVGLHQLLAIGVGESGGVFNAAETKGIVSSMINRINQAGTSLYDPGWLKKISYGGNTKTNFVEINGHNGDYNAVMGMSMSQIMSRLPD
jgi:hypothetical protein